jgi:hypothetical protein
MGGFPDVFRCVFFSPFLLVVLTLLSALHYPYVLAFEPTFIEVRHVESGALMQIVPGNNIRCLFADSPPSSSASSASSAASSYYSQQQYPNSPGQRYGRNPPASRSSIVVSDGDRAFSLLQTL